MSCLNFFFSLSDEFNRLSKHNCNFKLTQSLRLFFMVCSFAIWGTLLYVWAKAIFAQLQFYILTIWFFSISAVATSAGREVVEVKMVNKMKEEKLKDGSIQAEQVDEVELPSEEKSTMWKTALITYSMSTPLLLASSIMFAVFSESMFSGEVCKFYELADSNNSQEDCLKSYTTNPDFYQEAAGFRYIAFLMALIVPVCFALFEFMLNQLLMTWKHIVYQYIFTALYAVVTAIWQVSTQDAVIFPHKLDWICASRAGNPPNCIFDQCILWFIIFMLVQSGCFSLLLFLHYLKAKFCCKRSVPIVTYQQDTISSLGGLAKRE